MSFICLSVILPFKSVSQYLKRKISKIIDLGQLGNYLDRGLSIFKTCLFFIYLLFFFFNLQGREKEKNREPRQGSFLKCQKHIGVSQAQTRSQEFNLYLLHGWWGPNHLIYHLSFLGYELTGSLIWNFEYILLRYEMWATQAAI